MKTAARTMAPRRLNVVHLCNSLVRGGVEEHILGLLRKLDRERFQLSLVCTPAVAERMRPDLPADIGLIPLELRSPRQWRAAARLARTLRRLRADILHVHQFHASLFASPVGRLLSGVPAIVETPHLRERWRKGWKAHYGIDRFIGLFVDRYIAVSEANAAYLRDVKRFPAEKIAVIRNGTDLSRFDAAHAPPPGFRASLGIGERDPVLVTLARLEPQKGHRTLLQAIEIVRRDFPNVKLFCIGEGALRAELEAQAATLGLSDAVRFPGYRKDVTDWLALADFTVLPSLFEGLPLAALESLAAARTIVATAVDGTPEVVVHEETGLTVPPEDPPALATAIIRLLANPELRCKLAAQGRRRTIEQFDENRQVERTAALYLSLWERLGGPHA